MLRLVGRIVGWALGAGLAMAVSAQACEERSRTSTFGRAVALAAAGSPWDAQWQVFRQNVAREPSLCITYFTRGERRNEEQMFHDLQRNRAQIGGMSLTGLAAAIPEFTIAMAPFLFSSEEEVDFVYDAFLFEIANELAARRNLVILQWVEVGWSNLYSNRPVLAPQDMRGLPLRGSPNRAAQMFLEGLGADSVPLGSSDLVPALQTGLIEGGLAATVFHFFSTRRFASDFTLTRHAYDTGAIVVNKTWWDGLTPDQQRAIATAWPPSAEARAGVRRLVDFSLNTMREEGVRIHELSPAQRAQWVAATRPMHARLIREIGGDAQRLYDQILAGQRAFAAQRSQAWEPSQGDPP